MYGTRMVFEAKECVMFDIMVYILINLGAAFMLWSELKRLIKFIFE
jgi:ABC-type nickel/cobalt efflux system permease component RcnA